MTVELPFLLCSGLSPAEGGLTWPHSRSGGCALLLVVRSWRILADTVPLDSSGSWGIRARTRNSRDRPTVEDTKLTRL